MKDKNIQYPYIVKPLPSEDGGGFSIEFPDLLGCVSDGETEEEAIVNGKDAAREWLETCKKLGRKVPTPSKQSTYSGKILSRLPKYLHKKLAHRAESEGVSLNCLMITLIAEGLGRKDVEQSHNICTSSNNISVSNHPVNAFNTVNFITADKIEAVSLTDTYFSEIPTTH